MRGRYILVVVVLLALAFGVGRLSAAPGTLDSPAPPDDPLSASYTLEDIYKRLNDGTAGAQSTFTEPSGGPGTGTMYTLNQIMDKAPAADNTDGAVPAEVLTGKTYWSLRTDGSGGSSWGLETGTMLHNGAVTIVPTTTDQAIVAGYHNGSGYVEGDADLVAGNIRSGVTIFGVSGTCYRLPATGQTASYGVGDDGAYRLGCRPLVVPGGNFNRTDLPWTSSSGTGFTDNGDGTVTDNLTGLIWLKNANCFELRIWSEALSDANGLANGSCGLADGSSAGDWRLPNINELRSLIDPDQDWPALPAGHPFTGVQSSGYWSSTTYAGVTSHAWLVVLNDGYVVGGAKTSTLYVWPVRGGQ